MKNTLPFILHGRSTPPADEKFEPFSNEISQSNARASQKVAVLYLLDAVDRRSVAVHISAPFSARSSIS
jgi:hypothetical protein